MRQDKESVHALQRAIDKVNGYVYGVGEEAKEAYMMPGTTLEPEAPPYVRRCPCHGVARAEPKRRAGERGGGADIRASVARTLLFVADMTHNRRRCGCGRRTGGVLMARARSGADLLVREHYDEERAQDPAL